jgi:hypothetical protein
VSRWVGFLPPFRQLFVVTELAILFSNPKYSASAPSKAVLFHLKQCCSIST